MKTDSKYIMLPIIRGFLEISPLFFMAKDTGCFIAGGYPRYMASQRLRPVPANDVDVFPQSEADSGTILYNLKQIGFTVKHENDISITLSPPEKPPVVWCACPTVQIIKPVLEGAVVTVGAPEVVMNNFDFSIVRAAIYDSNTILADEDLVEDDKSHRLVLKNIHCPVSSMMRCIKYSKKGYWLSTSEAMKLLHDWDDRSPEYKTKINDLIKAMKKADGGEPSKEDVEELEKLMNID